MEMMTVGLLGTGMLLYGASIAIGVTLVVGASLAGLLGGLGSLLDELAARLRRGGQRQTPATI